MSAPVRVIPAQSGKVSGQPLGGGVITAAQQEAEVHRGAAPEHTRPLSPAEQRIAEQDEWLPDEPTGADALYTSGRVTVKTDRELAEARHRESTQKVSEGQAERQVRRVAEEATALAADYHRHTATLKQMAAEAKGDPAREAKVEAQIRQSAAVGVALKERGVL